MPTPLKRLDPAPDRPLPADRLDRQNGERVLGVILGAVRILKDLRGAIEGRDVLVVEDIVDTGFTLSHVVRLLSSRRPRKLKTIALLDKPSRREVDIRADWTGFEIPDEFVVGYGIDYAQRNRNLPFIGKVRFTE